MPFGSFAAPTQFYLYGRRHCTANGWRRASATYDLSYLDSVNLEGRVCVVTGANAGIGRCLSGYLAGRGATLYMVCRSAERGKAARDEIVSESGNQKVETLIGDVGRPDDVRRLVSELSSREAQGLDVLVCNAGAITPKRTITPEGFEVTLASQLIFGCHLLSTLCVPLLRRRASTGGDPRVIFVSSGGMYNGKFPDWETANSEPTGSGGMPKYNQELAYVYAKRGQVLLAEKLSERHATDGAAIPFVSCHPGWTDTPGVDGWLGSGKVALAPLRTLWQGTEGIAWLCVCPAGELEPGAFYLDRKPRTKHLAGPFFTEGRFTKNSPEEVAEMMGRLDKAIAPWCKQAEEGAGGKDADEGK
jgi:dehydrogenase/reductase SDR family protein 12